MRRFLFILFLLLPKIMDAQHPPAPNKDAIAEYAVAVHSKLSSSCELVQPATLIQYKQFDALILAGANDEIYSPVLRKGDFISMAEAVPQTAAKSAKKSGFKVHIAATETLRVTDKPATIGTNCPDLQQAISQLNRERDQRRVDLQQHLHRIISDVSTPVPLPQPQAKAAAVQSASQSSATPKVKKQGTVILETEVGIDGKVHAVKVVRSLDTALDQRAIEAVRQWQFSPARMHGLPVPVEIDVEFNFHLY